MEGGGRSGTLPGSTGGSEVYVVPSLSLMVEVQEEIRREK